MIDLAESQRRSRQAAAESRRDHELPFIVWPEDTATEAAWRDTCRQLPLLGYGGQILEPGYGIWKQTPVFTYLPASPYRWFLVDATGLGQAGEPALTMEEFRQHYQAFAAAVEARKPGTTIGLGVVELGEFRVVVAAYIRYVKDGG